eukprot:CAMPEP_0198488802 /NCGR_PEP_ID=MMETSP1462-20131121/1008_1 /TAXON_ID=1333877 /ORGANISM="Brandtodinium nutriculum, Strain RCC3387" /LENGTH=43 /DNA_ID= /DNA_START= /DNA_END= /DNA_ORIENTATION=
MAPVGCSPEACGQEGAVAFDRVGVDKPCELNACYHVSWDRRAL